MDSPLKHLEVGLSAHALVASIFMDATQVQGNCIKAFCAANSQLTLNASKTEVNFCVGHYSPDTMESLALPSVTHNHDRCLGVWWQHDLSPWQSVEQKHVSFL